jgi:hypothetical protein
MKANALVLFVGLALPGAVFADAADDAFERGTALGEKGAFAEAELEFERAWALRKSWDIAGNLGLAEAAQSKWEEAGEHLHYAMTHIGALAEEEQRKALESKFSEVKTHVGTVAIKTTTPVRLRMGAREQSSESPLFLIPGEYTVECTQEGYEPATIKVISVKAELREFTVSLVKKLAVQPPPPGESKPLWPAILLGVAGGAGLVVGGVGFGLAAAAASDADGFAAQASGGCGLDGSACGDLGDALTQHDTFLGLGVGGAIFGGLSLIGMTLYLVLPTEESSVAVKPVVGSVNGLVLQGDF